MDSEHHTFQLSKEQASVGLHKPLPGLLSYFRTFLPILLSVGPNPSKGFGKVILLVAISSTLLLWRPVLSSLTPSLIEGLWDIEGLILNLAYVDKSLRHVRRHGIHRAVYRMAVTPYMYHFRAGILARIMFHSPATATTMTSNATANRNCDIGSSLQRQLPSVPPCWKSFPWGSSCTSCWRNWLWRRWCKMKGFKILPQTWPALWNTDFYIHHVNANTHRVHSSPSLNPKSASRPWMESWSMVFWQLVSV